MSANEDLITWNTRWRLSKGIVSCKTCGAEQREIDREVMFEHQAGRGYAGQGARPWDDLYRLTTELKAGH